jgi:diguanylate cyclase (GGDEF)-like protein/PAS domain S-box-containing protein
LSYRNTTQNPVSGSRRLLRKAVPCCEWPGFRLLRRWSTARRRARHHAQRLSWVAEHTSKMAIVASADGRIEWVNDGFVQMTGYRLEDVKDLQPAQLVAGPDADPAVRAELTRAIHEQRDIEAELELHTRDGQPYWVRLEIRVLRHDDGTARAFIALGTDITELKTAERELAWRAHHDTLTGLANRQTFLARLNALQSGRRRAQAGVCALLSMDFDRFKLVNDIHGHVVGDELLCAIARRLETSLGEADLVARFGGDEFIVLLHDAGGAASVQRIAARISAALARPHCLGSGIELSCSASIGVIVLEPEDGRPAEQLLRDADAAMYQAKVESPGGYRFFDRALRQQMSRKALLEADLRRADFDAHLRLFYQPIVELDTGMVRGFEALVRWYRNGVELIPPMDFIPMAEDTGLIVAVGRWVMRRACADLARWRREGIASADTALSINVSRREIIEPGYCEDLADTVTRCGLAPADITLELTETALIDQRLNLIPLTIRLRDLGFRLAMDDFGTGQSSLNSLVDLPIEILKIDKQFIRNMGDRRVNHASIAVVHAIVTLAAHLNMTVVAEGLETAEQVATMQAMDCRLGQGFHFARPMPADQARALLRAGRLPARPLLLAPAAISQAAQP